MTRTAVRVLPAVALALLAATASVPARAAGDAPAQSAQSAQVKAGAVVYERCGACHALTYDRTGPHHCGLFGRRAGSVPGFAYSDAMKRSKFVWNAATLDRFIANPPGTVPGTSMGYAGVKDRTERAALIAFLKSANESVECRGKN